MAIDTFYDINVGTPVQVTRENYNNVGSGDNIVGNYTRGFFGGTDFEIWDSAVGGTQLIEGTDYSLGNLSIKYTNEAEQNVYSTYQILNPAYQAGNIYITYKTIGTFMEAAILDDINTTIAGLGATNRARVTQQNGGFWGDVIWFSSSQIAIKPKYQNGESWIGAILNDASYLEDTTSSSITVALDATTLDAIGAVQNNSWYWLCAYEDLVGALAFDLMFMPSTLISANNPTNDISLTQLNGQDIRSLYPVGAEVAIWESTSKFETPLYDTTGATYTPTSTDMVIDSYPAANQIRLSANLTVANFTAATAYCYLLNGFEPIDCTTEAINAAIGSRGWKNTNISIYSDASGNIIPFAIDENEFFFDDGTGVADYAFNTGVQTVVTAAIWINHRITASPPNKAPIMIVSSTNSNGYFKRYYQTYGQIMITSSVIFGQIVSENFTEHGIMNSKSTAGGLTMSVRGYKI